LSSEPPTADPYALNQYREYLRILALQQVALRYQGKVDLSGIVQETLWEAHRELKKGCAVHDGKRLPWLRRILSNNLADAVRRTLTQIATHMGRVREAVVGLLKRGLRQLLFDNVVSSEPSIECRLLHTSFDSAVAKRKGLQNVRLSAETRTGAADSGTESAEIADCLGSDHQQSTWPNPSRTNRRVRHRSQQRGLTRAMALPAEILAEIRYARTALDYIATASITTLAANSISDCAPASGGIVGLWKSPESPVRNSRSMRRPARERFRPIARRRH
jgi:DNA-directed RNA polymerase specialized sigma24 family protein